MGIRHHPLLALAALALIGASPAFAAPGPIYVMRHLERGGGSDDPPLTAAGSANAERLAGWFAHHRPVSIFVTATVRARATAAPLATRLDIVPQIYDPADPGALAKMLASIAGPVLVVGHSNTVPGIIRALGAAPPPELHDDDYARIWIVSRGGEALRVVRLADPQPASKGYR